MSEPELGKNHYNARLESIRKELGFIQNAFDELYDALNELVDDPGPQARLALSLTAMNAVVRGNRAVVESAKSLVALERFGRVFKQTGELNPEILNEK